MSAPTQAELTSFLRGVEVGHAAAAAGFSWDMLFSLLVDVRHEWQLSQELDLVEAPEHAMLKASLAWRSRRRTVGAL
jgi:hypothetical protein